MLSSQKDFNLTSCPFCGKTRFTACPVLFDNVTLYYVACDFDRGGCGADSGWYHSLKIPFRYNDMEYRLVDKKDYGHPINHNFSH